MTIRKNILFWLLPPIILVGVITIGTVYYFISKTVKQNIFDQLEIATNVLQENINSFLQEKQTRTIDFCSDGFIRECTEIINNKKNKREIYTTALNTHLSTNKLPIDPDILEVFVVDLDGKVIGSTNESRVGRYVSGEIYFSKAMKHGSSISDLHYSQDFRKNTFEISKLLFDNQRRGTIGIIVNRFRGDSLKKVIKSGIIDELGHVKQLEELGKTAEFYIVNSDKLMITSSRFMEDDILKQVVDTEGVKIVLEDGIGMIGIYTNYKGATVLGASKYFEEMDWVVLAEKDVSEAFAPIVRLRNITIIIAIAGIIVIVTMAIILTSGITKPIRKLVEGTRKISKEDYAYNIEIKAKNEIEYLTKTFNYMASLLRESNRRLHDYEDNLEKKVEDKTREVIRKVRQQKIEVVFMANTDGTIEYVSPAFEKVTGYSVSEVIGQDLRIFRSGKQSDDFYEKMWKTIIDGKIWRGNLINRKKNGILYGEEITITPIKGKSGSITNFVAIRWDMTEKRSVT